MAAFYELRYWKNFVQPDGSIIRLEIHGKGIEGVSITAYEIGPVVQALALTIQGQTEDVDAPIVKTSLTMTFVDAPDHPDAWLKKCGDWEEFYTNDSTYWKVLIKAKKNPSSASYAQLWGGYVTPDSFSEELRYRGSVTIVARDNIGHMQDFPFDAEGDENGLISLRELVETAWAKIESPMALYWPSARWLECEGVYAFDTRMNVSAFKDMNWYEAVEKALYSYGAVMRYNGENQVLLCSLRYMPQQARASMDQVTHIEPIFIAHAQRELVPAVRRIEETVDYELEDAVTMPQVKEDDFTGATQTYRCKIDGIDMGNGSFGTSEHDAPVWPIELALTGWLESGSTLFFNPDAYEIGYFSERKGLADDIYRYMYIACNNTDKRSVSFSRNITCSDMTVRMKLGQPVSLDKNNKLEQQAVFNLKKISYSIRMIQNGITNYLANDGRWVVGEEILTREYDAKTQNFDFEHYVPMEEYSGSAELIFTIYKIEYAQTSLANLAQYGLYACLQSLSFVIPESQSILKKNTVNTKYQEKNNVILTREPEIAPAYNTVALPGFIKNGIFYYDGNFIKPAKAWSWEGGTPQQMAVYNHLQLLCYHSKPNNLITGDIVNADVIKTAAIYVWGGAEHLLISGTYNYLNGRIEGAVLREFVRYDDMWGEVSGTSLPDTEQSSTTNQEGGGASSGPSSTNENTTNVVIGGEGGGSVTVDPFLSDTSSNPVESKAIKAYVDAADKALSDRITNIEENGAGGGGAVDTAMSDTSENAVQNKVIKKYVDGKAEQAYEQANEYTDEEISHLEGVLQAEIATKQAILVSGTNIKTINGQSIVGSGNITIQGGGATPRVEMTAESAAIEPNKFYVWPMMDELNLTLGAEQTGVMNRYLFQFRNPKAGVTMLTLPDTITWSEDTELDENGMPVMEAAAFYRIEIIEGLASLKKWKLVYIQFADAEVERVLMANGVGDGIGITKRDAAAVTSIGTWFSKNEAIKEFDEFKFFTGVVELGSANAYQPSGFAQCINLRSVSLPPSLKKILAGRTDNGGTASFYGCRALEVVEGIEQLEYIGGSAFEGCVALTYEHLILAHMTYLGYNALQGMKIKKLSIENVPTLPTAYADTQHYGDKSVLEELTISESVATIPGYSFYNYSALARVNLNNVITLNGNALKGTAVEEVNLLSVVTIGGSGFDGMKKVKKVHIGEHCTSIGVYNFWGWTSDAKVIIIDAITPPTIAGNNQPSWYGATIYVPDASLEAYKTTAGWSGFASIIKGISEYTG